MAEVVEIDVLAELFGVSPSAVHNWIADGLPVKVRGKRGRGSRKTQVVLRDAVAWYFRTHHDSIELAKERARLAREQADRVAMENETRRGELLDARLIGDSIERVLVAFRERIRALPSKLAPRLNPDRPQAAREILARELDGALTALADGFGAAARK